MSVDSSLMEAALDAKAATAIEAVGALIESLMADVPHPQEFGMNGCPACKTRDLVGEAADLLTEARELITLWQLGATAE